MGNISYKAPAVLDLNLQMDDVLSLPVDGYSDTLQLSVHFLRDVQHEVKVSQVPAGKAPVSLKRIALIFVTNAAAPQAFVKLIP